MQNEPVEPATETRGARANAPQQAEALVFPELAATTPAPKIARDAPDAGDAMREAAREAVVPESAEEPPATRQTDPVLVAAEPRRARHRAALTAGSTLLAFALMTQIAFHYRGEIVLMFPETRPALAEMCASLDCGVPLPRRAELISIESSDLQADPGNPSVIVLTAMLRNRAAFAQSLPSLELTLTDSQDQALARRILGVQDYLGSNASVEAGFTGNSELPIKVYIEASSLKATGYRLYLFFP